MPEIISKQCYFFFGAFHLVGEELTAGMSEKIWVWRASEFGRGGELKLPTMMFSKYKHHGGETTHHFIILEREKDWKYHRLSHNSPRLNGPANTFIMLGMFSHLTKEQGRTALWWMTQGSLSSWSRDFNTVHSSLHLCVYPSLALPSLWAGLTVNHHSCWQAPPLGHDVGCHTGIIPWIWEPGLPDDQVMVSPGVNVLILFRVNGLLVFQPFYLQAEKNMFISYHKNRLSSKSRRCAFVIC